MVNQRTSNDYQFPFTQSQERELSSTISNDLLTNTKSNNSSTDLPIYNQHHNIPSPMLPNINQYNNRRLLDHQTLNTVGPSEKSLPGISSTISNKGQHSNTIKSNGNNQISTEQDQRFFRLAREAIVATANATSNSPNKSILDPTLNDLFTRLQYVSSPHGNPIKSGENIKVNENGQLMIHEFYKDFPNLNNNIFQGNNKLENKSNGLIGDNPLRDYSKSESRKFQCTKCVMNFKRSSDLKRHEKQHLEIPPNICSRCGKGFARKDALKRHVGTTTCLRNAEKQLYTDNLKYLKE